MPPALPATTGLVRFVLIAGLATGFAGFAAWPVPDVNEAVYLTKARHAADPAWAAGDFFLETPAAHGGFYVLFGPLARLLPLEAAAWVGRWLGWFAVAAGFCHAVIPLVGSSPAESPRAGATAGAAARTAALVLLAGGLFALALEHTTMAGEWVLGGCEAKVFAWACILAGCGEFLRGRWAGSLAAFGAATALHVIVGGWGLVALGITWAGRDQGDPAGSAGSAGAGPRLRPWPALVGCAGLALAAWGVWTVLGLSAGATAADRAAATRVYVVERLHHHLLPRAFPEPLVARHLLAVAAWWLLTGLVPATPARRCLIRFTLAGLMISLAGLAISLAEPLAPDLVLGLLRYYWFRLADVLVPFALAVWTALVAGDAAACRRAVPLPAWAVRGALILALAAAFAAESAHWPLPGRAGLVPRADSKVDGPAWIAICEWVRDHAPPDACFLTPRGAGTFTWRTGRPEVVAWKNSPQDVAGLLEWRRRIVDCFSATGSLAGMERSTAQLGAEQLRKVAARYGARFAIVPADIPGLAELPFSVVHANPGYAVLDLDPGPR